MTLVELIITITIISIIAVPIGGIFIYNTISYYRDNTKLNASADMRVAVNAVLESFRSADQASITVADAKTVTFVHSDEFGNQQQGYVTYNSEEKQLRLKLMEVGEQERIILKNVESCYIKLESGFVSITISTETALAFSEPYIYTRTYDYKIRVH